ncbi:MAG TPA: SRPBCC domain-containing protein [Gaiella sp.]
MQIEREIVLPVPREEAWEALTEPERLEEWFANDVELDAVPGGKGLFEWDNGEVRHAIVESVEELERLVLRWDDEGIVELELVEHPAGTLVHVRETAPEWGIALDLLASAAWAIA